MRHAGRCICEQCGSGIDHTELDTLRSEVERLKAALREVVRSRGGVRPGNPLESVSKLAREALGEES